MLEPPSIPETLIHSRLLGEFALEAEDIAFLPLGVDVNTAVYRVAAADEIYFLKLRKGFFDETSVFLPRFLHEQGLRAVIPPLTARSGRLWGELGEFKMILYPFVPGQDGYDQPLSPRQWQAFGAALRAVHNTKLPPEMTGTIPRETFSPRDRQRVRRFQSQVETEKFTEPVACQLAGFMRLHSSRITRLVDRSEVLASQLQSRSLPFVLCHNDVHPGNLLLPDDSSLYLVDWDSPIFAPRERDLALIGGAVAWSRIADVNLFYRGYLSESPQPEIDPLALTYYRIERIVVDLAEFCDQLLATTEGGSDRLQAYRYFTGFFQPGREIDLALQGDKQE